MNLIKVKAVQDDSGHWYIIPEGLMSKFNKDVDEEVEDFDTLWGKFRTMGDINNIQLWADSNDLDRLC